MFSHTITRTYNDGVASVTGSEVVSADHSDGVDCAVAGGATDYEIDWTCTVARLKSVVLYCDRALTVCTNAASTGAPQETIVLVAGAPMIWSLAVDGAGKIPFAGNVTKLYVTLAAGDAATFKLRSLTDETPA